MGLCNPSGSTRPLCNQLGKSCPAFRDKYTSITTAACDVLYDLSTFSAFRRLKVCVSLGKVSLNRGLHPASKSLVLLPGEPMSEVPMASDNCQLLVQPDFFSALTCCDHPGLWLVDEVASNCSGL